MFLPALFFLSWFHFRPWLLPKVCAFCELSSVNALFIFFLSLPSSLFFSVVQKSKWDGRDKWKDWTCYSKEKGNWPEWNMKICHLLIFFFLFLCRTKDLMLIHTAKNIWTHRYFLITYRHWQRSLCSQSSMILKNVFSLSSRSEDDHQRFAQRREAVGRGHDAHHLLPHGFRTIRTTSELT